MSRYHLGPQPEALASTHGFSIVEAVVAAALLVISTVAIMSIFNSSTSSLRRSSDKDAISAAISADIAQIERLNDYYKCSAGSCSVPNPLPALPPSKFQYIPDSTSPDVPAFKQLCAGTGNTSLAAELVKKINETSTINAGTSSRPISIMRRAELHPSNMQGQHLYRVKWEWTPPQSLNPAIKRQIVLEPTVANWCP